MRCSPYYITFLLFLSASLILKLFCEFLYCIECKYILLPPELSSWYFHRQGQLGRLWYVDSVSNFLYTLYAQSRQYIPENLSKGSHPTTKSGGLGSLPNLNVWGTFLSVHVWTFFRKGGGGWPDSKNVEELFSALAGLFSRKRGKDDQNPNTLGKFSLYKIG